MKQLFEESVDRAVLVEFQRSRCMTGFVAVPSGGRSEIALRAGRSDW